MGSGIAQSCAMTGKFNSVTLQDVSQEQLNQVHARIAANLASRIDAAMGSFSRSPEEFYLDAEAVGSRITTTTEIKPKSDKNLLVIEAIEERLEPKQSLMKKLSSIFKGNNSVILATNTATLPCSEIGKFVDDKARFAGLHFFMPMMKLVEIVRTHDTNTATFESLKEFLADIDKVGVACKDKPGFIVNSLIAPYMAEAVKMLERGEASAKDIDTALKLGMGYPMGPFELMDYFGLDTAKSIVDSWQARGDDPNAKSKLLETMIAKGTLGKKTGKGFYEYPKKK